MIWTWSIYDFKNLETQKLSHYFYSHSKLCKWHLELDPCPDRTNNDPKQKDFISMSVCLEERPSNTDLKAVANFCVLDFEDDKVLYHESSKINHFTGGEEWVKSDPVFLSRSEISNHLSGPALRIGLKLTFTSCIDLETPITATPLIGTDYLRYFNTGKSSDFKIKNAWGKVIDVHKKVLAQNSTGFVAMFNNSEGEGEEACIHPIALDKMIYFLYSGDLEITDMDIKDMEPLDLIEKVTEAANKYVIVSLKEVCEQLLIDNLTNDVGTILTIFKISDTYKCSKVKEATIKFIKETGNPAMLSTKKWENFLVKEPKLANDIIIKISTGTGFEPGSASPSHGIKRMRKST